MVPDFDFEDDDGWTSAVHSKRQKEICKGGDAQDYMTGVIEKKFYEADKEKVIIFILYGKRRQPTKIIIKTARCSNR